jgi:mRNA interferase RelE/StbE
MKTELRKSAIKDLDKFDKSAKTQIIKALQDLQNFPDLPNCKKLVNFDPAYRFRVGDYRILFDVFNDIIYVARILHRKDAYKIK